MDFIFPQFLYGLFALSVPIIIHLFHFRRVKKVYFSNTKFLKKVKESRQSKKKLKHYLILASRLLFLFFLVMAFAQPIINKGKDALSGKNVAIYLDNSMSMGNETDEGVPALEEAIRYVQEIIDFYPVGTQFRLLTNQFSPFSNSEKSKAEIEEQLTELRLTGITRSMEEIEQRLLQDSELSQGSSKELFWISDFQKSTSGPLDGLSFDSLHRYHWASLPFFNQVNVYIDSLYLENPLAINREKSQLKVILKNTGNDEVEGLGLKVFINDVQSATTTVAIPPKGRSIATFDLAFGLEKTNKCRIGFEDFPVTFDNEFYFTLDLGKRMQVIEIKPDELPSPIPSVYGNTELFRFTSVSANNLNYSLIKNADLVIINGLRQIDASLIIALNDYLQGFGNLAIIPAEQMDLGSYQSLVPRPLSQPATPSQPEALASPEVKHPFFENVFERTKENFSMPSAHSLLLWGRDRQALLKYKNGMPYLSSFKKGGQVFLFGSPLNDTHTSLHRHALFVPIMYKIAVNGSKRQTRLYHTLDEQNLTLRMDSIPERGIFKLKRGQEEIIPEQRILGNRLILGLPKHTLSAGFYSLEQAGRTVALLAFNNEKKESLLEQYSTSVLESLAKQKPNLQVFSTADATTFGQAIKERYEGTPLWRYALLLALFFLLAEVLLTRFLK